MKQLLAVVVALASVNAFAARSRTTSLGSSQHLSDTYQIYTNPSYMMNFGDFVNIESGATSTLTENANAEGIMTRSLGDSAKLGFSLGHRSKNGSSWGLRSIMLPSATYGETTLIGDISTDVMNQNNPLEVSYASQNGDMAWGTTLVYGSYNDKKNSEKEEAAGFRLGFNTSAWDFTLQQGLINTAKKADVYNYKGKAGTVLSGGYHMDNNYVYGKASLAEAELTDETTDFTSSLKQTEYTFGIVNSMKKEGHEFFYGAGLFSSETKLKRSVADAKVVKLEMPVIMGFEAPVATWMQLRGSITQNILLSNNKTTLATGTTTVETNPGANTTTANVGLGLTLGKLQIDGNLSKLSGASATQEIRGDDLLTQVGMTYMF